MGFKRGARVLVNDKIGIVTTKLVRSPDNIRQCVKFDDGTHGVFQHTDLSDVMVANDGPSEEDHLRAALRGEKHADASVTFNGGKVRRT